MAKKPPPRPTPASSPKPDGLINQTGSRPGGTVTGSYKINYGAETRNTPSPATPVTAGPSRKINWGDKTRTPEEGGKK